MSELLSGDEGDEVCELLSGDDGYEVCELLSVDEGDVCELLSGICSPNS